MDDHIRLKDAVKSLKNERGSTAVDYAVILVCVVLAVIFLVREIEGRSVAIFNATTDTVKDFECVH